MEKLSERVTLLRRALSRGPVSVRTLLDTTGLAYSSVYKKEPGLQTLAKMAEGMDRLLADVRQHDADDLLPEQVDGDQLLRWLRDGKPDPVVLRLLRRLPGLRVCHDCLPPRLVKRKGDWVRATGHCTRCHNRVTRDANNPKGLRFREAVTLVQPFIADKDSELHAALALVLADPSLAITGPNVERASRGRIPAKLFARKLEAVTGLNKREERIDWDRLKALVRSVAVVAAILRILTGAPALAGQVALARANRRRDPKNATPLRRKREEDRSSSRKTKGSPPTGGKGRPPIRPTAGPPDGRRTEGYSAGAAGGW